MRKNRRISFRCTDEQMKRIRTKAEHSGLNISEYVLHAILNSRTRGRKVKEETARDLVQLQNSVNELFLMVKAADPSIDVVEEKVKQVQEGINEIWNLLK